MFRNIVINMSNEAIIRFIFFGGVLLFLILWERLLPRRKFSAPRIFTRFGNLGLSFAGTLLIRFLFPLVPVALAIIAKEKGWGLFNAVDFPYIPAVILSVLAFDLVIYLQHVMFHTIPVLWKLHLVHHADLDLDATTGLRFHPIEFVISMAIKLGVVVALGTPALSVLIFEIVLNATAMFNHSNIYIPRGIDRILRLIVVTPDMHRVHHSVIVWETNSNFGFNLPWWDRLLGTYRAQPVRGHEKMNLGLGHLRDRKKIIFPKLFTLPFTAAPGRYSIRKRDFPKKS